MNLRLCNNGGYTIKNSAGKRRLLFTPQILKAMKLTFFLLTVCFLQLSASGISQNVTVSFKNVPLFRVFKEIEKQSGFGFLYSKSMLKDAPKIDIDLKNTPVAQVLEYCFKGQPFQYSIQANTIIITRKKLADLVSVNETRPPISIRGKVTDESGEPIVGATVQLKNSSRGTSTNSNGEFEIEIPDNSSRVLVFSFVGMQTQEINVGGKTDVNLTLVRNITQQEEVVLVGYGAVRKANLAGAITSVSPDKYKSEPVTNITQALQGRAAGVNVTNNSGAPGGAVKVRIRGANSLLGNNDPLYVVDGIILNVGIGDLNINDIENFEVLKDAAATAIYGSRGANGVILITTKRGKSGTTKIQADVNIGMSKLAQKYDLMQAGAYAELTNILKPNYFTSQQVADFKTNGGVDWQDQIFQTGVIQNYQMSASGGSSNARYFVSANYIDHKGILLRSSQKKYSVRSNISADLSKKVRLDFNLFAGRIDGLNNQDNGYKGAPTWASAIYSPTFPIYTAEGVYNRQDNLSSPNTLNPYMVLKERYADVLSNSLISNAKLSYKIIKNLSLDVLLGANSNSYQNGGYINKWLSPATTSANLGEAKTFYWQNSNILTYSKIFGGKHDVTVTAVNEQSQNTYRGFGASGSGIDPITVTYNNLGIANVKNVNSSWSQYGLRSYVGRVGYSFLNRYIISATYRADGTSKFQGKNKWGYFPSVALGWKVSEEYFLRNNAVINNLKIRGSWGKTGNQGINPYATVSSIGNMMNTFGLGQSFPGSIVVGADNPDLKWETTAQADVGFDLSLLQNRINFSADYFVKNTSDLLNRVVIPAYNGGGTVNKNIGKVQNKGADFSLGGTPILSKDFKWDASLNFTALKSKVVDLGLDTFLLGGNYAPGLTQESPFAIKVGQPLGSFWGYNWEGVYSAGEAAKAAGYGFKPGDNKYTDWNNDGKIDSKDKHVIGFSQPKYIWGFNNSFTYKRFDLNIMTIAQQGNKILNTVYAAAATILSDATSIAHVDGLDYWSANNPNGRFANPLSSSSKNFIESTQFLEDASFVKIKNLSIGYSLDRKYIKFADLQLLLSVQNLKTFTKYRGYDPETSTSIVDSDGAIDVGAYPSSRTFTIGLKATF